MTGATAEVADRARIADVMVAALAREIVDGDVVGVGLGTPLAVAAALLARATTAPGSHVLVGGAVDPRADLATCLAGPRALLGRTAGYVPHLDTMGMAEGQAMTLQYLRPAQVDGRGQLNTSRVGTGDRAVLLPGGLATADVPRLLPRLVIYLHRHRLRALPAQVDVVTGPAGGWDDGTYRAAGAVRLVTDLAVIALGGDGAVLESVHPGCTAEEVVAMSGFELTGVDGADTTPEPSAMVQAALDRIDPHGVRAREIT